MLNIAINNIKEEIPMRKEKNMPPDLRIKMLIEKRTRLVNLSREINNLKNNTNNLKNRRDNQEKSLLLSLLLYL